MMIICACLLWNLASPAFIFFPAQANLARRGLTFIFTQSSYVEGSLTPPTPLLPPASTLPHISRVRSLVDGRGSRRPEDKTRLRPPPTDADCRALASAPPAVSPGARAAVCLSGASTA